MRIIDFPKSYQIRIYDYDKELLMARLLSSDDKERRERRRRLREQIEARSDWTYVDADWDELDDLFDRQKMARKSEYGLKASARAKKNVYYLARSNEWEWFVTLTLDGDKIDRYDYDELVKKVRKWFNNLKQRKAPDCYYLIVPEQHKDGAWHFHGLLGGCAGLTFVSSGKRTGKTSGRKLIYNFEDWNYGFSTATKVDDAEKVSSYICKYITKTMAVNTEGKNRYWASKNCKRAPVSDQWLSTVDLMEFKESLYDLMDYKKRVHTEFCNIDYFEIRKSDERE